MAEVAGIPFGSYLLIKRLARGGMAEVFLARQRGPEGFDRRVAVKRILPHLAETPDFVNMFFAEARLAAGLSHPNVVHIYEFGKVGEHFFIAMEHVDGIHAGDMIKRGTSEPLPPSLVARIGADACAGLHYAHNHHDADGRPLDLVHRDVSPPNLMISFGGAVKLVDFGIAKAATQIEQTRPGVVKGKFAYMSPEQTMGKPLDGRSDVFSLGLVLWELLAGRVAVRRDDPVEGMRLIRDGKLPAIETARPGTPPALAAALGMALAVDRDQRATAAELGLALEAFIKSSPELGTSMHLADWVQKRFPRNTTGAQPALNTAAPLGTVQATASAIAATAATSASPLTDGAEPTHPSASPPFMPTGEEGDLTEVAQLPAFFELQPDIRPAESISVVAPGLRRRARTRRIAIIAVAAIAAGIAGLLLFRRDRGESPAAPANDPSRRAMAARDAAPPAPMPDAAPALAVLEIVTDPPGASVVLGDGEPRPSPVTYEDLEPGTQAVIVELDGYQSVERMVNVSAGERRTLEIPLQEAEVVAAAVDAGAPEPVTARDPDRVRTPKKPKKPKKETGKLTVRTTPYSVVYLGGKKLGTTPFANVTVPVGTHTLTFKNPDRKVHKKRVRIRANATTKLNFALP